MNLTRTIVLAGVLLTAGSPLASAAFEGSHVTATGAFGVDDNVFLSDRNTGQTPQTSRFIQTNLSALVASEGARPHRLTWTLRGWYRHYLRLGDADKLTADTAIAYRYAPASFLLLGLVPSVSYARLQLLDTEGNTLPRGLFASYRGETRVYAQALAGRTRVTIGGGVRRRDINEIPDLNTPSGPVPFASLDHQGYFAETEAAYQSRRAALDLSYEYGVMHYAELRANSRTGVQLPANPKLSLIQHTISSHIQRSLWDAVRTSLEGRLRWTLDPFEDDLTSRQIEGGARTDIRLPFGIRWTTGATHRVRTYLERQAAVGVKREERFLLTDTSLERGWTRRISTSARYQFIRKSSNVANDEFRARIYSVGLSLSF
ncbi:MAG: hypothetical protein ABIO65_00730 [Nitrospiria bacterium]